MEHGQAPQSVEAHIPHRESTELTLGTTAALRNDDISEQQKERKELQRREVGGLGVTAKEYDCRICGFNAGDVIRLSQHLLSAHPVTSVCGLNSPKAEAELGEEKELRRVVTEHQGATETEPQDNTVKEVTVHSEVSVPSQTHHSDQAGCKKILMAEEMEVTEAGKDMPTPESSQRPPPPPTPQVSPPRQNPEILEGQAVGAASGTAGLNQAHLVCLPLVAKGLKLMWVRSEQTEELDSAAELMEAFNAFPYPTEQETNALARRCALTPDRVRVWFMMQRVRYGISWPDEDVRKTRRKLGCPHSALLTMGNSDDEQEEEMERAYVEPLASTSHPFSMAEELTANHNDGYGLSFEPRSQFPTGLAETPSPPHSDGTQLGYTRPKKSKAQLNILRRSFVQRNWPSDTEVQRLQGLTGLRSHDIRKWFADSRYQLRRNGRRWYETTGSHPQHQAGTRSPQKRFHDKASLGSGNHDATGSEAWVDVVIEGDKGAAREASSGMGQVKEELEDEIAISQDHVSLNIPGDNSSTRSLSPASSSPSPSSLLGRSRQPGAQGYGRRRRKKQWQVNVLRESFRRCQWPTNADYQQLQERTGLSRSEIVQWFGDTRYHIKHYRFRWLPEEERLRISEQITQQQQQVGKWSCRWVSSGWAWPDSVDSGAGQSEAQEEG